jgi:hypothetical protein
MLFLASLLGLAVSANCLVVRDGQGQKNSDGSTTNPDGTISCTTDAQCQWHPESTTAKQCKYKPQVDDPWLQTQIEILANIGDGFCNTKYLCDCETNTPEVGPFLLPLRIIPQILMPFTAKSSVLPGMAGEAGPHGHRGRQCLRGR